MGGCYHGWRISMLGVEGGLWEGVAVTVDVESRDAGQELQGKSGWMFTVD